MTNQLVAKWGILGIQIWHTK